METVFVFIFGAHHGHLTFLFVCVFVFYVLHMYIHPNKWHLGSWQEVVLQEPLYLLFCHRLLRFKKVFDNYENIHTGPYKIISSSGNSIYGDKMQALFPWKNKLNIGILLR